MTAITTEVLQELIAKVPLAVHLGIAVEHIRRGTVRLSMPYGEHIARPVDTVSGPALLTLADVALWGAVLSMAGAREMVVTTNLNLHFLRMAGASDMVAEARVLKMGRRLAVAAVELITRPGDELVAHATASYAIPD